MLAEWVQPIRNHFWHCAEACAGDTSKLKVGFFFVRLKSLKCSGLWGAKCGNNKSKNSIRKDLAYYKGFCLDVMRWFSD